jgi:hypothetical protein
LLSGKIGLGALNGSGATHDPVSSLVNSESIIVMNLRSSYEIMLLIGRDLIDAHHVENQITGPQGAPFAQKLSLGWVIVGEVCIDKFHKADTNVNSLKTNLLVDGRTTFLSEFRVHNCHEFAILI